MFGLRMCIGCDPHIMGIGPVPAVEALLKVSNHTLHDIDVFEVRQHRSFCFGLTISYG